MTPEMWFSIVSQLVMWFVALFIFVWGRDQKKTEQLIEERFGAALKSINQELAVRDLRIETLDNALENNREESSKQTNRVTAKVGDLQMAITALDKELRERVTRLENHSRRRS